MKIDKIIIHCADTPEDRDFAASDIDRWHRERGFSKIGYHYVIRRSGQVETGRKEDEIGAHCKGQNQYSLGICLIGRSRYTPQQWASLRGLIDDLITRYPEATLHGHNEFSTKACPGFDVRKWKTENGYK